MSLNSDNNISNSNNFYGNNQSYPAFDNNQSFPNGSFAEENKKFYSSGNQSKTKQNSVVKLDEKKKQENNHLWMRRFSQNPHMYERINKEDEYMLQDHLHNLKKKEGN